LFADCLPSVIWRACWTAASACWTAASDMTTNYRWQITNSIVCFNRLSSIACPTVGHKSLFADCLPSVIWRACWTAASACWTAASDMAPMNYQWQITNSIICFNRLSSITCPTVGHKSLFADCLPSVIWRTCWTAVSACWTAASDMATNYRWQITNSIICFNRLSSIACPTV